MNLRHARKWLRLLGGAAFLWLALAAPIGARAPSKEQPSKVELEDLKAQKVMAEWAARSGKIALLQLAISVAGTVALVWTIRQGRAAIKQGESAHRRDKIAMAGALHFDEKVAPVKHAGKPCLKALIRNCGQSRVKVKRSGVFALPAAPSSEGMLKAAMNHGPQNFTVLERDPASYFDCVWEFPVEGEAPHFGAWLVYDDIFGDAHVFPIYFAFNREAMRLDRIANSQVLSWLMNDAAAARREVQKENENQ